MLREAGARALVCLRGGGCGAPRRFVAGAPPGRPLKPEEVPEGLELGVMEGTGSLLVASAGALGVFAIGAAATLGAAVAAATMLGRTAAPEAAPPQEPPRTAILEAELAGLRASASPWWWSWTARARANSARKAEITAELEELRRA